ncbi:hypothetical protein BC943DRAFT_320629 [Umbelopsis sp. AD052]|nr:hypothetical protein BC943DRAFT_320629 [Umbelopsis sp. AD052]
MSSVSSHDGSEKELFHPPRLPETLAPRFAYLRKTDILDTLDSNRFRDTDAWSVAATIDDQESVLSGHGGSNLTSISGRHSMSERADEGDDNSTLDGVSNNTRPPVNNVVSQQPQILEEMMDVNIDTQSENDDDKDDDKASRSNAAEFGDDRSAVADFGDDTPDNITDNNVVSDEITAPPQPQPSFAVSKSYVELLEENEMLQNQLRNLELAHKQQALMMDNLKTMVSGSDGFKENDRQKLNFGTSSSSGSIGSVNSDSNRQLSVPSHSPTQMHNHQNNHHHNHNHHQHQHQHLQQQPSLPLSASDFELLDNRSQPIINSQSIGQKLEVFVNQVSDVISSIVTTPTSEAAEASGTLHFEIEQQLFQELANAYLTTLPFGTENHNLLNTAYSDQITRFNSTLGANFAKWYRKQTVQSLSLNPATKQYLANKRRELASSFSHLLQSKSISTTVEQLNSHDAWNNLLDLTAELSLEIHAGAADVFAQPIAPGSKFDDEVMRDLKPLTGDKESRPQKVVNKTISPLFIDEEELVVLPARVLLE